jgi:hypothetical protein
MKAISQDSSSQLFKDQLSGLLYIRDSLQKNDKVYVYLRMHPNLSNVSNPYVDSTLDLEGNNFYIIPPESRISTYKLLDKCAVAITFGSTVGVEATYWGKPSILIGNSFYKELDVTYNVETPQQLIQYIMDIPAPKEKQGAFMYGYYEATYGTQYKHYQPIDLLTGTFKHLHLTDWSRRQELLAKYPLLKKLAFYYLRKAII